MNYLFTYLRSLDPDERETLAHLTLRPRERETLDLLLAMEAAGEGTREVALERLAMSGTMFDKTCSVLLRQVYARVVPEGGMGLLGDLHGRGLYPHLLHELRTQERGLATQGREERLRFYHALFDLLHQRFTVHYDAKLAGHVARRLAALEPATRLHSDGAMLGMEIWRAAAGEADEETDALLLRKLQQLQRRVERHGTPRARYRLLRSWVVYYGQIDCRAELRADALDSAIALCSSHPAELGYRELLDVQLIRAEHEYFFGSSHRNAYLAYRKIFDEHPEELARQGYHRAKYTQLAMILGEYSEVEELLERFAAPADDPDVGRSKSAAVAWAKLYLMTGRYREAWEAINLAIELNQKRFFVQFEIECRLLQTAWYVLSGNGAVVEELVPAHLKYLRSKGYTLSGESLYPWFFKLVLALIDARHTRVALPVQLEGRYERFQQGAAAQYGLLLRRMRGG